MPEPTDSPPTDVAPAITVPGTRIVVNDQSPWPERTGATGVVVDPPPDAGKPYPWHGLGASEAVVLLDDDPTVPELPQTDRPYRDSCQAQRKRGWSCVMGAHMLDPEPTADQLDRQPLTAVERLDVVEVHPGDVIIATLRPNETRTPEAAHALTAALGQAFPGNRVVVVGGVDSVTVARPDELTRSGFVVPGPAV